MMRSSEWLSWLFVTQKIQGRLNQWAHWARAQGPRIFFFLRDPQLAVVKFFLTNYLIVAINETV